MVANALFRIACYGLLSSSYKRVKRFCLRSAGFYLCIETMFSYMYVYTRTHTPVCIYVPVYTHLFDSPTRRSTNLLCPGRAVPALAFPSCCGPKLLSSWGQGELLLSFVTFKAQMD